MNQKEFLNYLNDHLPPTLGKAVVEDLKQWEHSGILRPHPDYYHDDIHKALGLMQMKQDLRKMASTQSMEHEKPTLSFLSSKIIYQVLAMLGETESEAQMQEKAKIKMALVKTGLISTLGFVYINFSPLTGNTLESLLTIPSTKARFERAAASKELLVIQDTIHFVESKTGNQITTLTPVLFIQGVQPTVIYSTLIFSSYGRLVGPQQYIQLPHPLYEEFLHLDVRTFDDILKFMTDHLMIGSLGVPYKKDAIDFVKTTQEKMRSLLLKAAKGSIAAVRFVAFVTPPRRRLH